MQAVKVQGNDAYKSQREHESYCISSAKENNSDIRLKLSCWRMSTVGLYILEEGFCITRTQTGTGFRPYFHQETLTYT